MNDNLVVRSSPLLVFVYKVLLNNHVYLLMNCIWLLLCYNGRVQES